MQEDRRYCSSSFLMYRTIVDNDKCFDKRLKPYLVKDDFFRERIYNCDELEKHLNKRVKAATQDGKAALMLSGGIDSAILAKFMPKGSTVYTLKCIVPSVKVTDETVQAGIYATECGLKQKIVEVYWEDYEKYSPILMKSKGAPIHSIEVQIYKAALQAKKDGFDKLIFGENADIIYGGMDGLLSKDWTYSEFVDRYTYVYPHKVLRDSEIICEPFLKHEKKGYIDGHEFTSDFFRLEALGSYYNSCSTANMEFIGPYVDTIFSSPIDYDRIRSGDSKYVVREVYKKLYPLLDCPKKIPMPRPMDEWLKNWDGPTRNDFIPHSADNMTGDQRWMVYILEKFLNELDKGTI